MLNVYLPGYSLSNQSFSYRFTKRMKKLDWPFYSRKWAHWLDEEKEFSAPHEAELSTQILDKFKKVGIGIIAKSIGTLVAAEINQIRDYELGYLVLMGIPTEILTDEKFIQLVEKYSSIITIIQNQDDPVNDTKLVKNLAEKYNLSYIEKDESGHQYEDREEILGIIEPFNNYTN